MFQYSGFALDFVVDSFKIKDLLASTCFSEWMPSMESSMLLAIATGVDLEGQFISKAEYEKHSNRLVAITWLPYDIGGAKEPGMLHFPTEWGA